MTRFFVCILLVECVLGASAAHSSSGGAGSGICVLTGCLVLDVKAEEKRTLRAGNAFYLCKGTAHRGYAAGDQEVRLITASYPASYKP